VIVWAPPPDAEDKSLVHTWKVCQLLRYVSERTSAVHLIQLCLEPPFLVCRGHADDVVDLAWSHDGSGLVTTSIDNTVILWDTAKGKRKVCT
jgi:WD40 repeat protein